MESFHCKLRDECLRANWFRNLFDARLKISDRRKESNELRPHSSLDYRTPNEFVEVIGKASYGKDAGYACLENASGVSHFEDNIQYPLGMLSHVWDATKTRQMVLDIAFCLVDNPASVILETTEADESTMYLLRVPKVDAEHVVGRGGRTAHSIRILLSAIGRKENRTIRLKIVPMD